MIDAVYFPEEGVQAEVGMFGRDGAAAGAG